MLPWSLLLFAASPAQAWPVGLSWYSVQFSGSTLVDPIGDTVSPGPGGPSAPGAGQYALPALDLVGTSAQGALRWSANDDALYLRLQLAGSPLAADGALQSYVWGALIDANADGALDLAVIVDSPAGVLRAYPMVATAMVASTASWPGYAGFGVPVTLGDLAGGQVRVQPGPGLFSYLDLTIPRHQLAEFGIGDTTALRLVAVTGVSITQPWVDVAPCDAFSELCDVLPLTTAVTIDADADGLTFPQERARGTNPLDADSDDDGLLDGEELAGDANGDGRDNARVCDADGDGLPDGLEAGLTLADLTPATDLSVGCFVADLDPTTTTDPWSSDTDGGGLPDALEDFNGNGRIDDFETDPNDPSDDLDTDGDGIADVHELRGADGSVDDEDSDGDGIPDSVELLYDPDGDGIPAFLDLDSDGDGIPDAEEGYDDVDQDGIPNFLDLDSDGDGVPDSVEYDMDGDGIVDDTDGDGIPDYLDTDSDNDGIPDSVEADFDQDGVLDDFDGDGIPDLRDLDSDNDGVPDEAEGQADTDGDGVPDRWDDDSDNDGIPDAVELLADPDRDGIPAFQDTNSDGDRLSDRAEGTGDVDCDGIPNYLDADDEDGFCTPGQPLPSVDTSAEPVVDSPPAPRRGGCAVISASPSLFALWLVAALVVRRRR